MAEPALSLFALGASRDYGERIAGQLGIGLAAHEERAFEDGEHKARPLVSVRDHDVYVIHSLYGDAEQSVNDKLCRLLFFIGALKDAGCARATAVIPYLGYARKDRQTQARDPVTTRYVACLLEAVGVDRVVTLEVHNLAAYQNAFRCRTEHLEAKWLFAEHVAARLAGEPVVVSPDAGGIKRAELFRQALSTRLGREVPMAIAEKHRALGVVSGEALVGEVRGRTAIIIDDVISTGTTLLRAARACRAAGAVQVHAAASHGLFVGAAHQLFETDGLDGLVVTDTVPPWRLQGVATGDKLTVLDAAPLFAEAIRRLHGGGSLVELLEG